MYVYKLCNLNPPFIYPWKLNFCQVYEKEFTLGRRGLKIQQQLRSNGDVKPKVPPN